MKVSPIIFSGPMVRAILAGRKSQTRRVMRPQPDPIPGSVHRVSPYDDSGFWWSCAAAKSMVSMHDAPGYCPYGLRGDRLWVRETWHAPRWAGRGGASSINPAEVVYRADEGSEDRVPVPARWRSPIHMPHALSRLELEVTGVRIERLQQIDELDACAEGCPHGDHGRTAGVSGPGGAPPSSCREWFAAEWDGINARRAFPWSCNPWVWVIEFRRSAEEASP